LRLTIFLLTIRNGAAWDFCIQKSRTTTMKVKTTPATDNAKALRAVLALISETVGEAAEGNPLGGIPESFLHLALESELGINHGTTLALVDMAIKGHLIKRGPNHLLQPVKRHCDETAHYRA
jgi:hypothetical protein